MVVRVGILEPLPEHLYRCHYIGGVNTNAPTLRDLGHRIRPFPKKQRPSSEQKWRTYWIQAMDFFIFSSSSWSFFSSASSFWPSFLLTSTITVVPYWGLAASEDGTKQRHSECHLCKTAWVSFIQHRVIHVQLLHYFFNLHKGSWQLSISSCFRSSQSLASFVRSRPSLDSLVSSCGHLLSGGVGKS